MSSLRVKLRGRGEHEGPWALRHAELGRPVGYADTPLDDQQAMLGLHRTTNTPRWDSIGYAVLCYCSTRSVIKCSGGVFKHCPAVDPILLLQAIIEGFHRTWVN